MNGLNGKNTYPDLLNAAKSVKSYVAFAGLFSAATNLLMLVPIIYMLQVYDRVVSSGSYSTLAMLTILMIVLLIASGGFEWVRSMYLIGVSGRIDKALRSRVSDATFKRVLFSGGALANTTPMSDLQSLRQFLTGNGVLAVFDAPWCPIYIGVMFLFHPWFGVAATLAVGVMIALAVLNNQLTKTPLQQANTMSNDANARLNGMLQNAEVIAAMGMDKDLGNRQASQLNKTNTLQAEASTLASLMASIIKTFRLVTQSLLLGLGALLALNQEISPGMMIAGSLLLGRALSPIDILVANWKNFTLAQTQYNRLGQLLNSIPAPPKTMSLPAPSGKLKIDQLLLRPPGSTKIVARNITLELNPGEILGIIGPSASGKSCLARAMLGIWPATAGKVRLDGVDVSTWDREELGPHVGYLPQDIELFDGSISENICRFSGVDSEKVIAAAEAAGVHQLILNLPDGYDTHIGVSGGILSGGQRQRIGLARALYGGPKLLVLDEPNSNLDDQGEKALSNAISEIASTGSSVVIITHRTSLLSQVHKMLVLKDGLQQHFGTKDEVFAEFAKATQKQASLAK